MRKLEHRRFWMGLGLSGVALGSLAGWVAVLSAADARQIDDLGLISVVPPTAFAFVAVLSLAFVVALRMRPQMPLVLVICVAALAFMLYGASAYFEEMPRFATAWLHVGFTDAIARTGELFPFRDARFDWPAFFTAAAFISSVTGVQDLLPFVAWVPPLMMLLYLGPLYLIMRSATSDGRLVWLAIWLFYLVNWVGQDYFSPQAFNVLLLLAVVAILLTWFRQIPGASGRGSRLRESLRRRMPAALSVISIDPVGSPEAAEAAGSITVRQQIGLVAMVAALFGASVASHQLTPFALVGGVVGLTALNRIRLTGLPVFMIVLLGSWLMLMATTFLTGHLAGLLDQIGRPDQVASATVGERIVGSPGHVFVVQARLAMTAGVWGLAAIGGLRRLRWGQLDLTMGVLAVVPFGLLLLQAYGGEMLLRAYLFSAPFMAFFAAAAFLPSPRLGSWGLYLSVVVVSVFLAGVMLFTRYGNEKADFVTALEYDVLQHAATAAEPGDAIGSVNHAVPLGYLEWEQHRIGSAGTEWLAGDMDLFVAELANRTPAGKDMYFVITRGQRAYGELFWNMPDSEWDRRVQGLASRSELVYANADGAVYRVTLPTQPAAP